MGLAMSTVACCLVSTRVSTSKSDEPSRWLDIKHFKDAKFMLLVLGSVFVSLGQYGYQMKYRI